MISEITDSALDEFYPDPQQIEEIPIYMCAECKGPIYEGDFYYYVDGEYYCEDCADKLFRYEATRS